MDHQENCNVLPGASDMISNLPEDVIEAILMYLPTRDAVRTSILARGWRYRWAKLPQLILDEILWNESVVEHSARLTVARILYQLLLLHEGPIVKFSLSIPELEICPEIDNLIFFLSRNGIEDLTLEMWTNECYILPQSFSKWHQLRHLSLWSCLIETTPEFRGFSRLITLKLCDVSISSEVLGCLISNSPFLELLDLVICSDVIDLEIDAPNLRTFSFEGELGSLLFKKVPLLASVSVVTYACAEVKNFSTGRRCNFVEFFHSLPVLEYLDLGKHLVKLLAADGVPSKLLTALVYLKTLKLSFISLADSDELSSTLCLIRSPPNLKHLDVQFDVDDAPNTNNVLQVLEEQDYSDIILNDLKEVKLKYVTGTRPEMELIKLLLANSPSLKEMLIQHEEQTADEECKVLKELIKFPRASKEAEVIYEDIE